MSTALSTPQERTISYRPLGGTDDIRLTINMVRQYLCTPTRSGAQPGDAEVMKYMMLCKSRQLDPWVGDAYLVGYDSKDGPQFSLITAHQALLKRGEASPHYDGMDSGVVVQRKGGEPVERPGKIVYDGETLIGGWARVYRKDRQHSAYASLLLKTFNSGRSRWAADPAGMICKCAEAEALRKAFPSQCAGMYTADEMDRTHAQQPSRAVESIADVTSRIVERREPEPPALPQPVEPAADDADPIIDWYEIEMDLDACETKPQLDGAFAGWSSGMLAADLVRLEKLKDKFAARFNN